MLIMLYWRNQRGMNIMFKNNDNYFKKFCKCSNNIEELREKCEDVVEDFIRYQWNRKFEFYVECEDTLILSIMVCDEIDRSSFEQFIITPLCDMWDLEVRYVEILEGESPYIEWGLIFKNPCLNMNELENKKIKGEY